MSPSVAIRPARAPRRRPRPVVVLAALALVFGLVTAACGDSGNSTSSTTLSSNNPSGTDPVTPGVAIYTDGSTPITVAPGQAFALMLKANPSTGYTWVASTPPNPAVLLYLGTEFKAPKDAVSDPSAIPAALVGVPTVQLLHYVAKAPGATLIGLRYAPPGQVAASPSDQTQVFAVVVPDPNAPPPPPADSSTSTVPTR